MNREEKRIQLQKNFQNGRLGRYSLKVIIPLLIFFWPVGIILLIKRIILTKDFPRLRKNAVIALIIFVTCISIGVFSMSDKEKADYMAANKNETASQENQRKEDRETTNGDIKKDSVFSDKEFKKKIKSPIAPNDIIELYNSKLTEEQRMQLLEAVDNDRKSYFIKRIKEDDGFVWKSIDQMVSSLEFLDEIQSDDWNELRRIQKAAQDYKEAENSRSQLYDEYKDASNINTKNIKTLNVYVLYKATNSKRFIVTDYTGNGDAAIPAYNWYGAVEFKQAPSHAGVMDILVASNGTFKYETDSGFEGEITQYKEISQTDIEYSEKMDALNDIKDGAIAEIKNILGLK